MWLQASETVDATQQRLTFPSASRAPNCPNTSASNWQRPTTSAYCPHGQQETPSTSNAGLFIFVVKGVLQLNKIYTAMLYKKT